MTRAERSARNKRAHAVRRAMVDALARDERAQGHRPDYAALRATVDEIPADVLLSQYADVVDAWDAADAAPAPVAAEVPARTRRRAPAHVAEVAEAYRLARMAWERGLEEWMAGARPDGKPARGEDPRYTDEERTYREQHPAPTYRDFLTTYYAERRALEGDAAADAEGDR